MIRVFIPKFRSIHHLVVILLIVWIGTFAYHERLAPGSAARHCLWPAVQAPTNVLLVADPQLIDNHTYPGRFGPLLTLSQHTVDAYLKRNYKALLTSLKPDYVVFLGDLLDNARDSSDAYFANEHRRFQGIFQTPYPYQQGSNLLLNTPGNHDIGFGDGVNQAARTRFINTYGDVNTVTTIADVDFYSLDSLSYSADAVEINHEARAFVGSVGPKSRPRILLSHVPLYRDSAKSCGPLRESAYMDVAGHGYQYKNNLDQELSRTLIQNIQPDVIFSGDDHDYCDIVHAPVDGLETREITVKSISMAMGIKYPAVQLLSFNSNTTLTYDTQICYLQTPYINVANYIFLAVATGLLVLLWNIKQKSPRYTYSSILPMTDEYKPSANARKISNFLKEQDQLDVPDGPTRTNSSSYYLYSSNSYTTKSSSNSGLSNIFSKAKTAITVFVRKWNLLPFFKHSMLLGTLVICIYYFGFILTL
ncbi:Metallo-dependent phosphatase [Suhomyces tanzawaensis NRRL Y-17324]|uniref:Metallo-dependent phosphatase n=1 Tax=Suhomyces tanzawaensis NRRL Y-17324 TaxID=984487 RepID=A0A1E4SLZ7_9ASCO|nr:Metallo-dependent phosphatase [Suhomyces tanzawaensis NRRL Y-17324]ODV80549.1 Metallo-dependent phosphatase [Suhomyces tanzawaensis NRRL Y-17324]